MQPRLDFYKASPDAARAMLALEAAVNKLGLEPSLLELVKLRASQINGCAYCVDLHSSDARKRGESERRLHAVAVWREAPPESEVSASICSRGSSFTKREGMDEVHWP